jgi:uncharacterized repeat protein (TIGR01451 family)
VNSYAELGSALTALVPSLCPPAPDRSDAPVSYGEATHTVVNSIKLGAAIDRDPASIANATASGDGTDDDGISSFPTLNAGATSHSIPAANITATGTGTLHAWIDFNKNGTFESGEYTSVAVASNTPAGPLNWSGITAGAAGNTFARFRFTSDATVTASNPSGLAANGEVEDYQVSISAPSVSNPKVLLVKRITAINGTPLNIYKDDTDNTALHAADDNNANWPTPLNANTTLGDTTISTFLRGAIDGGKVKPGDTIEYTIYFLNTGDGDATNVRVCDRIIDSQKILSGSPVLLQKNSATPTILTSSADTDRATFYTSSSDPAITKCNFTGTPTIDNGAIVVDVTGATGSPAWTTLPGSTGAGTTDTYGFVRFTTKVNP